MQNLAEMTTEYAPGDAESNVLHSLSDVQKTLIDAVRSHTEFDCLQSHDDAYLLQELSPIRQNLLDWISFSPEETALELGGRTGILTELLCRRCKAVTSVVATETDASMNAVRNRNAGNLSLRLCAPGTGQDIGNVDTVIMVDADIKLCNGLFAETGSNPHTQYSRLLALAYDCLKPQGRLILAVNNRLGIQYWSGKTDACSPSLFSGIQGDSEDQTEFSFSKKRLAAMLEAADFDAPRFYYPVPDFRYPAQIFSDHYLPQVGDIRPTSAHYDDIRYQLFDEKKAFDSLCEDGLFDLYANSFLVLCNKGGE